MHASNIALPDETD